MQYRRLHTPGGSLFFTLVTEKRRALFRDQENVDVLREAFRNVKAKRPFVIDAIVIMPDHLHCIWTLPPDDGDFSVRWRLVKTWFTKHCRMELRGPPKPSRCHKHEQSLWQRRFWEHTLRDEADFTRHVEYIHYNPVKHGYVSAPVEWPYSSFHKYVTAGTLPVDWGADGITLEDIGHE